MDLIKRIWAVIVGTGTGIVVGILFDWLSQNGIVPLPENQRLIMYPWVAGGGAFLGALVAVLMTRLPRSATNEKPAREPRRSLRQKKAKAAPAKSRDTTPARGGSEIKSGGLEAIKLDHVDGMPGFDFDETAGGNKPEQTSQK